MHLHGSHFRVDSRGDAQSDSLLPDAERELVVTETVLFGGTFSMLWVPQRVGNWLFHCHTLAHISPTLRRGRPAGEPHASNARFWEPPVRRYVDECVAGAAGPRGADWNMRWIASLVAEVHRILVRGGVFLYPRDAKQPGRAGRLPSSNT